MSVSGAGSAGSNNSAAMSLVERMRRERTETSEASEGVGGDAVRPQPTAADSPESTGIDPQLLDRAHEIARSLLAGEVTETEARRQVVRACLDQIHNSESRPMLRGDVEMLLASDLQFRAEVDNMLVLAARELEGGSD